MARRKAAALAGDDAEQGSRAVAHAIADAAQQVKRTWHGGRAVGVLNARAYHEVITRPAVDWLALVHAEGDPAGPGQEERAALTVAKQHFIPFSRIFPTPQRPYGITDRAVIEQLVEREAGKPLC